MPVSTEIAKSYAAAPFSYAEARAVADELSVSDPVAVTLVRRGYRTPAQARAFLAADESHPPSALQGMGEAVERILAAVRHERSITVHGDFDVDGVCATAIAVSTLRGLGGDCDWLIPDRIGDGYGLGAENLRRLAERGTELLLTVDCGITAVEEVKLAQELGMEVIVTDHHQPGEELPDCLTLHPGLGGYPFAELCGTAVAWKLACGLCSAEGVGDEEDDLDLVALATVADVVPLVGENRSLVRRGLAQIRRARRPGMRALLAASGCEPSRVDESDLAFRVAPRINAAGRLYRADAGVELFLAADEARTEEIALELSRVNSERRAAEREVANAAEAALRSLPEDLREAKALVVAGRDWHPGVIGIVASRLVDRHHRPAIVISLDGEGRGRGSGRSVPGFDLHAALGACAEHLVRFGGHRAAAGLELRAESIDAFRAAFVAYAGEHLSEEGLRQVEHVDATVGGASLGLDLAEELGRLAPFGAGNPGVRLLVPAAQVSDVRPMGQGKHSRFSLHSGSHRAVAVAFGKPSLGVGDEELVDATVRLEVNHWNGSVEPRLVLHELYPQGAEPPGSTELREWWERFEAELGRTPGETFGATPVGGHERRRLRGAGAPAALLAELACSGESVLAVLAAQPRRPGLEIAGVEVVEYALLESDPGLGAEFEHVVLVDPPAHADLERLALLRPAAGGYLHLAWGEGEWRTACAALDLQLAQRGALVEVFRDLRGAADGSLDLTAALRGEGPLPRSPEASARCWKVLCELGLLSGEPARGEGSVGVVSSEGTELERSAAFRIYRSRYEECRQYLERRKKP